VVFPLPHCRLAHPPAFCVHLQTNTGSILVSLNPYKRLAIYTQEVVREYIGTSSASMGYPSLASAARLPYRSRVARATALRQFSLLISSCLVSPAPHIFATAEACYHDMRERHRNQSVIIRSACASALPTSGAPMYLNRLCSVSLSPLLSVVNQVLVRPKPRSSSCSSWRHVRPSTLLSSRRSWSPGTQGLCIHRLSPSALNRFLRLVLFSRRSVMPRRSGTTTPLASYVSFTLDARVIWARSRASFLLQGKFIEIHFDPSGQICGAKISNCTCTIFLFSSS
jgi:hypothetical protein